MHSHSETTKWIYHTLHRAHSLQVTRGQGVEAKAKATVFFSWSCPRGRKQSSRTASL